MAGELAGGLEITDVAGIALQSEKKIQTIEVGGLACRVLREVTQERRDSEAALLAAGVRLPLEHRCAWAAANAPASSWFLEMRSKDSSLRGGFAIEVNRSRAMPGHLLLRVPRLGNGMAPEAIDGAVEAIVELARRGRTLRINVETYFSNSAVGEALSTALERRGFKPVADCRRYRRTLSVDLSVDETAVFASFHGTARRHIRAIAKHPVQIRPISDDLWGPRMNDLMRETMDRTGGFFREISWRPKIELTNANPNLATLLGLFRTDKEGPESLLAYAWSCMHGDYAHYDLAASTRNTDLKLPLNYALAWESMRWAKQAGATWYDFGGITGGRNGDGSDRLGGISDFKRYFSKKEVDVGGEWILEPHWLRATVANGVSAAVGWLSSLKAGRATVATSKQSAPTNGEQDPAAKPVENAAANGE